MSSKSELLVYGAYGYTGKLICERLTEIGQAYIAGGRNEEKSKEIAEQFGVPFKVFSLDNPADAEKALENVSVVLHCAGPYSVTSRPMVDVCIKTRTHYLDITGEYTVIEAVASRDAEIRAAGILAMPSVGMDVVPSDCISAYVANKLPSATQLKLYISFKGGLSAGTAKTMVEMIGGGSKIRKDGKIVSVPFGALVEDVKYPNDEEYTMINFPWGDVSSAYHTTKINNVTVFMASMSPQAARIGSYISPVFNIGPVRWALQSLIGRFVKGDGVEERKSGSAQFLAVASDGTQEARAYLKTISGYSLTAISSVIIAQRALKGDFKPGFHTPAGLYGADLVLEIPGTERKDL
ncbi:Saccharopine dehydrogenase-like oxidoreductase [Wickerhamiella sorbophila]|uniref:Saccharopine dehydrogenase-like oxidoreductase n=1 Tax=Wickerhamiella sorbophila TaxID=45607 RepID=A0A2T0FCS9_9ASCO|nr:Saccharopine dehydrogenase-like oxidoreductase [Wickerhamiella sorbophila]PRT52770.1 Saccharopine dehydrogenase-like oxidoreductase [Wickerhamiella sorbophila]